MDLIAIARADGNYKLLLANLRSKEVVIIDDFGLAPIASRGNLELLDILDERIGVRPLSSMVNFQLAIDLVDRRTLVSSSSFSH